MKERMITRTVSQAKVAVLGVNLETHEVVNDEFTLSAIINIDKVVDYLNRNLAGTSVKYVSVTSYEVENVLYGMTEAQFISLAEILPPRKEYDND